MTLRRATAALAAAVGSLLLASTAQAATTLTVDDDRTDCPAAQYTSIQAAVDAAAPGDTVAVCAGDYEEGTGAQGTNAITISTILRYVRPRSVSALYALREDFGEVIETQALPGSRLVRSSLDKLRLPKGMMIGAVVRGEQVFIPTGAFQVEPGDRVIATVTYDALRKAEDILEGA